MLVDSLATTIPGTSRRTSFATGPAGEEPFLKRRLAFSGRSAREETFNADILIKLLPVNSMPSADQSPAAAFYRGGMNEAWKPSKWHGQAPSIAQLDGERVFRHGHRFGDRQRDFNRRSIHPMPPEGCFHTQSRANAYGRFPNEKILRFPAAESGQAKTSPPCLPAQCVCAVVLLDHPHKRRTDTGQPSELSA